MTEDRTQNPTSISEEGEESRRQQQESQASEQAEQAARDAQDLDAEEFTQAPPEAGTEEQPFGNRKDDTGLLTERTGTPLEQDEEPLPEFADDPFTPDPEQAAASRQGTSNRPGDEQGPVDGGAGPRQPGAPTPPTQPDPTQETQTAQARGSAPPDRSPPEGDAVGTPGEASEDSTPADETDSPNPSATSDPETGTGDTPASDAFSAFADTGQTDGQEEPPTAQTPSLSLSPAQGLEDGAIALNITALLKDTDQGDETLTVRISNVPPGAVLSAGTDVGGGIWQLSGDQLTGLTITPPSDSNEDFSLTVTATSTESTGETASVTAQLPVDVVGVADVPELNAELVPGQEDTVVDLNITGSLTDTDGSETLSYLISDLPEGSTLSAGTDNGDGTWTLTPDDLNGLQFTPPEHFSGEITFNVDAISTENDGDTATTSTTVTAAFAPVADAPTVTVGDVTGQEDTGILLDLDAALVDPSETLSVIISGVPDGATFSSGTKNPDDTWSIDPADLPGLTVTPAQ